MDVEAITKGFLAGAAIAAPLGPVGLLCIHRGIFSGRAAALLSGLGAATAHGTYALAAALGLSFVSGTVSTHQLPLQAAAGFFLCILGGRILFFRPAARPADRWDVGSRVRTPPHCCWAVQPRYDAHHRCGVFGGRPARTGGDTLSALRLAAGVFLGSATWWLVLASGVGWLFPGTGPSPPYVP